MYLLWNNRLSQCRCDSNPWPSIDVFVRLCMLDWLQWEMMAVFPEGSKQTDPVQQHKVSAQGNESGCVLNCLGIVYLCSQKHISLTWLSYSNWQLDTLFWFSVLRLSTAGILHWASSLLCCHGSWAIQLCCHGSWAILLCCHGSWAILLCCHGSRAIHLGCHGSQAIQHMLPWLVNNWLKLYILGNARCCGSQ